MNPFAAAIHSSLDNLNNSDITCAREVARTIACARHVYLITKHNTSSTTAIATSLLSRSDNDFLARDPNNISALTKCVKRQLTNTFEILLPYAHGEELLELIIPIAQREESTFLTRVLWLITKTTLYKNNQAACIDILKAHAKTLAKQNRPTTMMDLINFIVNAKDLDANRFYSKLLAIATKASARDCINALIKLIKITTKNNIIDLGPENIANVLCVAAQTANLEHNDDNLRQLLEAFHEYTMYPNMETVYVALLENGFSKYCTGFAFNESKLNQEKMNRGFIHVIDQGDTETVETLIGSGLHSITDTYNKGPPPLVKAFQNNDLKMAYMLLIHYQHQLQLLEQHLTVAKDFLTQAKEAQNEYLKDRPRPLSTEEFATLFIRGQNKKKHKAEFLAFLQQDQKAQDNKDIEDYAMVETDDTIDYDSRLNVIKLLLSGFNAPAQGGQHSPARTYESRVGKLIALNHPESAFLIELCKDIFKFHPNANNFFRILDKKFSELQQRFRSSASSTDSNARGQNSPSRKSRLSTALGL